MLGAQQQKRIESIRLELDYCLHKINDVDSVGKGLEDLRSLVMRMEPSDIPGVLSSGLLDSVKMRPMGRRFSIKIVEYIVQQFGSESTLPYLTNIISFLIQGCRDPEIHVQNSAVSTVGQISRHFLVEETFQINPDVLNIFMDPLIQFSKKESNPSIQISGIAAISAAIDGISMNIIIMNLNKLMSSLIPIMMNPNTAESCRAVVIDALRKVAVLVWTFLQETPFGSSPKMYDLETKSLCSELEGDNTRDDNLVPPMTWKHICGMFGGILKELHPNHTTNSKNVNVRSASLSLLTEIMVCCFVAQAGALLAAHSSKIPLQKPIDGIKSYAEVIIAAITQGSKDRSPKVREVAQYCMKRLQEANEAYIPDSQDFINITYNQTLTTSDKEQQNNLNVSKANRHGRTLNEDFFKNATDEIIVRHVSPPSNWRQTGNERHDEYIYTKDNDCKKEEDRGINTDTREACNEEGYGEVLATTRDNGEDLNEEKELNSEAALETQSSNISASNASSCVSCPNCSHSCSTQSFCSGGGNPFLLGDPGFNLGNSKCNTPLPSPLYFVSQQQPLIQGQMITAYSGLPQVQAGQQGEQAEKQAILEKRIEELTLEIKKLNSKQKELENVAHVLKMLAIHRVDSLENKIEKLSNLQKADIPTEQTNQELETSKEVPDVESEFKNMTLSDFKRQIYNKAKEIVSENVR